MPDSQLKLWQGYAVNAIWNLISANIDANPNTLVTYVDEDGKVIMTTADKMPSNVNATAFGSSVMSEPVDRVSHPISVAQSLRESWHGYAQGADESFGLPLAMGSIGGQVSMALANYWTDGISETTNRLDRYYVSTERHEWDYINRNGVRTQVAALLDINGPSNYFEFVGNKPFRKAIEATRRFDRCIPQRCKDQLASTGIGVDFIMDFRREYVQQAYAMAKVKNPYPPAE